MVTVCCRANTTTSTPASPVCVARNDSRMTRFTRLRSTARGRWRLATASPRRARGAPPGATMTTKPDRTWRRPFLNTARNWADCRSLASAGNVAPVTGLAPHAKFVTASTACDPWHDAHAARHGQRDPACVRGIRAYACGVCCLAGKFFSWLCFSGQRHAPNAEMTANSMRECPVVQPLRQVVDKLCMLR